MNDISELINKIHCGDCLDLMREMPDKCVDLVLTDPPFNINLVPQRGITKPIAGDNQSKEEFIGFLTDAGSQFKRILKDDTYLIIFCGWSSIPDFRQAFDRFFTLKSMPVWVKNNFGIGYFTRPQYEPCMLYLNGKPKPLENPISDVWFFDKIQAPEHSCQKPTPLIQFIINSFSMGGDTVFDPFLGSGTTAVAAVKTGRKYIGIEKEPEYIKIAEKRLEKVNNHKITDFFGLDEVSQ